MKNREDCGWNNMTLNMLDCLIKILKEIKILTH